MIAVGEPNGLYEEDTESEEEQKDENFNTDIYISTSEPSLKATQRNQAPQ